MTDHEWHSLNAGDRISWCGSPPGASGVVLAINAWSMLIAWDDGQREAIDYWYRSLLELERPAPERAAR